MTDEAGVIYLVHDQSEGSVLAKELVESSERSFEAVGAGSSGAFQNWHGDLPALITSHGTWFGLEEIKAYLGIPSPSAYDQLEETQ